MNVITSGDYATEIGKERMARSQIFMEGLGSVLDMDALRDLGLHPNFAPYTPHSTSLDIIEVLDVNETKNHDCFCVFYVCTCFFRVSLLCN